MTRIGIYLRISDDQDGTSTATDRQRSDCQQFAERHGWEVADVFEDRDLSAFKRNVKRPEFERMLTAVRYKNIDGVLAWKMDRISRRQRDLVRLDEECESSHGFIATVIEGIDTREPTGRFVAELLVAQARMESENQSLRLKRRNEEMVRDGKPQTGGSRMFGYSQDRQQIIPDEAELIREAVQRVYDGQGLRSICWDWQRREIKTPASKRFPNGGFWRQVTLKRMLLSAALSGQREHLSKVLRDDAKLTPGTWPAIITPDDTRRLRLILNDPARTTKLRAVRYLLTGFLICGVCGERLVARPRKDGVRRYICARQPGMTEIKRCGKIARVAEPVEDVVKESILFRLEGTDLKHYIAHEDDKSDELLSEIRKDEEQLTELSTMYADRAIGMQEWLTARDRIQGRLEANRAKHNRANGRTALNRYLGRGEDLRSIWDTLTLDERRSVIAALIDRIEVLSAVKGDNRFNPALINIQWKI